MSAVNGRLGTLTMSLPRYEDGVCGLPSRSIPFTNSERMSAACPRRHLYAYVAGRPSDSKSQALSFGRLWHLLLEDIYRHWMVHDTTFGGDDLEQSLNKLVTMLAENPSEYEDPDELFSRLNNAILGWIDRYSLDPLQNYRVIGVEQPYSRPVINPNTGKVFRPISYLVKDETQDDVVYRPARYGELDSAIKVRWPYYQVGKLDAILIHRKTGAIWAWDHKSSGVPLQYTAGLTVDPQRPGYVALLKHALEHGWLNLPKDNPGEPFVAGFVYDIASSRRVTPPSILKSGELSKQKNRQIPSWLFLKTIHEINGSLDDYEEHIEHLQENVDPKMWIREWLTVGHEPQLRYNLELYAEAKRIAQLRRWAVTASKYIELASTHPRVPICRTGSGCGHKSICAADSILYEPVLPMDGTLGLHWSTKEESKDHMLVIDGEIISDPNEQNRRELGW